MKRFWIYVAISLLPSALTAETLTPEQALRRAGDSGVMKRFSATRSSARPVYTAMTESSGPAVYVFNRPQSEGFVFLSADDVAMPVLWYSDRGTFDPSSIPPQMEWWLGEYARQIAYASSSGAGVAASRSWTMGEAISPMIRTKWNQGTPYNDDCPQDGEKRCVTGCVATAMAQVMYYWKYPEKGTGTVTARVNDIQTAPLDLSTITFDWDNMTDTYDQASTPAQKKAVAALMKACGYSVDMGYTVDESGAQTINLAKALVENFGYNENITFLQRNYFSGQDWNNLVYGELKAGRPVLYSGASITGSHQFVCDGYDGNGYFHINWGWGGMSDGYFLLEALNPGAQGTGGSAGGYNYAQTIIQGVQKDTTSEVCSTLGLSGGNLVASAQGLDLSVGVSQGGWLSNIGYKNLKNAVTGFIITPEDGGTASYAACWVIDDLQPGWGWNAYNEGKPNINFSFAFPEVADGRYHVRLAYRCKTSEEWIPVMVFEGYAGSFTVVKSGATLTIENGSTKTFSVSGNVPATVYLDMPVKFSVTVKNDTDIELTKGVYPGLYDSAGNVRYGAEGFVITLSPGEEITKEWISPFYLMYGQTAITEETSFMMRFFDPDSWIAYNWTKPVKMNINNGVVNVETDGVSFPGEKLTTSIPSNNGSETRGGYLVNSTKFPIEFKLVNKGTAYFGYELTAALYSYDYAGGVNCPWVAESKLQVVPSLNPRKNAEDKYPSQTLNAEVEFPQIDKGKSYFVALLYKKDGKWEFIKPYQYVFFRLDLSGVDGITDDGALVLNYDRGAGEVNVSSGCGIAELCVMTVSGSVASVVDADGRTGMSVSLRELPAGMYIVSVTATDGRRKSLKVVR